MDTAIVAGKAWLGHLVAKGDKNRGCLFTPPQGADTGQKERLGCIPQGCTVEMHFSTS